MYMDIYICSIERGGSDAGGSHHGGACAPGYKEREREMQIMMYAFIYIHIYVCM